MKSICRMDVHKETIQMACLTSNSKALVKEQQIKHEEGQIQKFIQKLKSEGTEIHCCYEAGGQAIHFTDI
ncbi:Transposase domain protein [Leptospira santarosai]|nr:Transposase domain protein [Leptospira santarosai]